MRTEKQILTDFFNNRESKKRSTEDYKKIYNIMKKCIIEKEEFYTEILMKYIINN